VSSIYPLLQQSLADSVRARSHPSRDLFENQSPCIQRSGFLPTLSAFWRGEPVAFDAWLPFVGRLRGREIGKRGHRTVCLPDYQGVGIGGALFCRDAALFRGLGYRVFSGTGHPAEIANRLRHPELWRMTRAPGFTSASGGELGENFRRTRASSRVTASFEYCGPPMDPERAKAMLDTWAEVR